MWKYIVRRVIHMIPVLFILSIIGFLLMSVVLGDPVILILAGAEEGIVDPAEIERLREKMGFNRPLPVQYLDWMSHVLVGDLGRSFRLPFNVIEIINQRIPVSLELGLWSVLLGSCIGIPLGVMAAVKRESKTDYGISALAVLLHAVPTFMLGVILIFVFAVSLGWLPPSGYTSWGEDPVRHIKLMILPSVSAAGFLIGLLVRYTRATMLDVLGERYVTVARAKGLTERIVLTRHALRNAMIPVVTVMGLEIVSMFSGWVVTETIYGLPGIGRLMLDAIFGRDMPVVQGVLIYITVVVIIVNLLIDLSYAYLDPKIRYE
jgi:peptide/nickel transport system permease protein